MENRWRRIFLWSLGDRRWPRRKTPASLFVLRSWAEVSLSSVNKRKGKKMVLLFKHQPYYIEVNIFRQPITFWLLFHHTVILRVAVWWYHFHRGGALLWHLLNIGAVGGNLNGKNWEFSWEIFNPRIKSKLKKNAKLTHCLTWHTRYNLYLPPGDLLSFTICRHWRETVSFWTTYPWLSRLQPECQDVEEGGGRIRSWSSCIWSLIGRRRPQKIFNKPSKISSPSSC